MFKPSPRTPKFRLGIGFHYIAFGLAVLLIVQMIPRRGQFKYDFELGRPWAHDDLKAPFTFPIEKSPTQLEIDKRDAQKRFKPFYNKNMKLAEARIADAEAALDKAITVSGDMPPRQAARMKAKAPQFLRDIYDRGIIKRDTAHNAKRRSDLLVEVNNRQAQDVQFGQYYTLNEARESLTRRIKQDTLLDRALFLQVLMNALEPNVTYDKELSDSRLLEMVNSISPYAGIVREGETIITRGNYIGTPQFEVLTTLKHTFENELMRDGGGRLIIFGYFILVALLMSLLLFNLDYFSRGITRKPKNVILILLCVVTFVFLTRLVLGNETLSVYIVPFCIAPIILSAFFGIRIAVFTHVLTIAICGLMVPRPFEFLVLQLVAGFVASLAMLNIRYVSQFFLATLLILLSYSVAYMGFLFIQSGRLSDIDWENFIWFGGNFLFTLLAYPLIFVNEKFFGFLSDISLLELSDINNKLLKELSLRAPGTFQHVLQVANLAEAVIDRIGGNTLLTRVGALYHDIGKMSNPDFFIENQRTGFNPHSELSPEHSAEIIIGHVPLGIEAAHEHHLPERVIDFIRTHHGTTRVEYFYHNYMHLHPDATDADAQFRYPGPKPTSKETAVVMMADSIDAASRALKNPDEMAIDKLVDKIIDGKIQDNQFDYAMITIQDINNTRRILKKLLKSFYHIRVIYPGSKGEQEGNLPTPPASGAGHPEPTSQDHAGPNNAPLAAQG